MSYPTFSVRITSFNQMTGHDEQGGQENPSLVQMAAFTVLGLACVLVASRVITRANMNMLYCKVKDNAPAIAQSIREKYANSRQSAFMQIKLLEWNSLLSYYINYLRPMGKTKEEAADESTSYFSVRQKRLPIKPAARENVRDIFKQYIRKGKILELGSNLSPGKMKSALGALVSEEDRSNMIYSDKFPLSNDVLQLDVTNLGATLSKGSQANITALSVIDLISRNDLQKVVKGLHCVLKSKGRIIILSDLPFDEAALIEKYSSSDTFILPLSKGDKQGIKLVRIDELKRASLPLGPRFSNFIESLISVPNHISYAFLSTLLQQKDYFWTLLEELCPADSSRIIYDSDYIDDLKKAFLNHKGFTILESGFREKSVIEEGDLRAGPNCIASDLRMINSIQSTTTPSLKDGQTKISSTFFVFVAEKK